MIKWLHTFTNPPHAHAQRFVGTELEQSFNELPLEGLASAGYTCNNLTSPLASGNASWMATHFNPCLSSRALWMNKAGMRLKVIGLTDGRDVVRFAPLRWTGTDCSTSQFQIRRKSLAKPTAEEQRGKYYYGNGSRRNVDTATHSLLGTDTEGEHRGERQRRGRGSEPPPPRNPCPSIMSQSLIREPNKMAVLDVLSEEGLWLSNKAPAWHAEGLKFNPKHLIL